MSVESDTDRLEFLDTDEFGTSVQLVLGSPAISISGIFEDAHIEIDFGHSSVSSNEPHLWVRSTDVGSVTQNTEVLVNGAPYTVKDIRPDGTGMTILELYSNA